MWHWRNYVQNSALHHRNILYLKMHYNRKPLFLIVTPAIQHNITALFCIFYQIIEGLMSKIYAMCKKLKTVMCPNFWPVHFCMITENRLAERASQLELASKYLKLSSYCINTFWYLLNLNPIDQIYLDAAFEPKDYFGENGGESPS